MADIKQNGLNGHHSESLVASEHNGEHDLTGEHPLKASPISNGLCPDHVRNHTIISQLSKINIDVGGCGRAGENDSITDHTDSVNNSTTNPDDDDHWVLSNHAASSSASQGSYSSPQDLPEAHSMSCVDSSLPVQNGAGEACQVSQENGTEEVMMRNTRQSLHRKRHTDTAIISNVFHFLQTAEDITEEAIDAHMQESQPESCAAQTGNGSSGTNSDRADPNTDSESANKLDGTLPTISESNADADCGTSEKTCEVGEMFSEAAADDHAGSLLTELVSCQTASPTAVDGTSEHEVRLRRSRLSKQESTEDGGSEDSSDEDVGVYAESFRRSNWIRIDEDGKLELTIDTADQSRLSSASQPSPVLTQDIADSLDVPSPKLPDEVFNDACPSPRFFKYHKRSESTSTTLSEREFKKEYVTRRKCLIQRQNSSKEYHRFSARVYNDEKAVVLEKDAGDTDFGLHILDSQPAFITQVVPDSPADRAGVQEGQILVTINGTNVLTATHDEIVNIMAASVGQVHIAVATSDFQPSRNLQASVMEGYMQKQSEGLVKLWKKRYFILRQDSCLYYYKQKDDTDPLGAIPLAGYTFSRHLDHGRDFGFKAEKYGAKTYYFVTESRDEMTEWVGALTEAAARSKKRKESFVSVSSHNVSLPALEVRRPECTGYLLKVGLRHRTWRRRYCVLKDACLYYYKNMSSLSALGVAHLHGYKVDLQMSIGKKHAFGLVPPDPTLRTFQFSAENDTDRQRWVEGMIRSIQRWVQVDNDC